MASMITGVKDSAGVPASTTDPNSKPFGVCPQTNPALGVIDETRPSNVDLPDLDVETKAGDEFEKSYSLNCSAGPVSSCQKKGMKDRIRGLKDKYVSCLQAIDGAGDIRPCAASGGCPSMAVPDAQPFDSVTTAASHSTASIAN